MALFEHTLDAIQTPIITYSADGLWAHGAHAHTGRMRTRGAPFAASGEGAGRRAQGAARRVSGGTRRHAARVRRARSSAARFSLDPDPRAP